MLLSIVVRAKWMLLLLCVGWCPLGEENAAGIGRPTHLLSFFSSLMLTLILTKSENQPRIVTLYLLHVGAREQRFWVQKETDLQFWHCP